MIPRPKEVDTCKLGKECPMWRKHKNSCFNYVETWWTPVGGGQPYMTKDCAPVRGMYYSQECLNMMIDMRADYNQTRNVGVELIQYMQRPAIHVSDVPKDQKLLEDGDTIEGEVNEI